MTYVVRTLINCKQLSLKEGWYVAVPEHHVLKNKRITVKYDHETMAIGIKTKRIMRTGPYRDKVEPIKTYYLLYYLWQPDQLTII